MKLLATDLDGTLLDINNAISPVNIAAITNAQIKGLEIVPCTGRVLSHVQEFFSTYNIKINYVISSNGAQVSTFDGDILFESLLNKEDGLKFLDYAHQNELCYSIFTTEGIYSYHKNIDMIKKDFEVAKELDSNVNIEMLEDLINLFNQDNKLSFTNYNEIMNSNKKILSISAITLNKSKLKTGLKDMSILNNSYVSQTAFNNFQIVAKDCNKGSALEFLSKKLNITFDDIIAIGDNGNDLSMLKKAKISIAMGNSSDDIKDICTYVAPHHNESGFGHAISNLLSKINL